MAFFQKPLDFRRWFVFPFDVRMRFSGKVDFRALRVNDDPVGDIGDVSCTRMHHVPVLPELLASKNNEITPGQGTEQEPDKEDHYSYTFTFPALQMTDVRQMPANHKQYS